MIGPCRFIKIYHNHCSYVRAQAQMRPHVDSANSLHNALWAPVSRHLYRGPKLEPFDPVWLTIGPEHIFKPDYHPENLTGLDFSDY